MNILEAIRNVFADEAIEIGDGKIVVIDGGAPVIQERNGQRTIYNGVDDLMAAAQRQAPADKWKVRR